MTYKIKILSHVLVALLLPATVFSQTITTVVGGGSGGGTDGYGSGLPATNATLGNIAGISFDKDGNLIIADKDRAIIRKVDKSTTIITTIAGTGISGFSGDSGPSTAAQINFPGWIAIDTSGKLLFSDRSNNRIRNISFDGTINTIAGNGIASFSGDGGPASAATFANMQGICLDRQNNIYIAANSRVRKIDNTTSNISTIVGNGIIGFSGDEGPATNAQIKSVYGIRYSKDSNLYIADWSDNRIRRINLNTGIITTLAGTGIPTYSGDGVVATTSNINPYDVEVDNNNNIFIADYSNNRIRRIDEDGTITTVAGNGITGFSGDGGAATEAKLNRPAGLAFDPCGNLYIADNQNYRIRKVTYHPYATPSISISGVASATVGATVTVAATVTAGAGSYTISWLRNGALLATTSTPSCSYTKGPGTDTITARLHPTVAYCSDTAASTPIIIAELPVGAASIQPLSAHIYPTPTTGTLHIQASAIIHQAQLQSLTGATLATYTPGTHQATISIAHLPPGIYTLRINHQYIYKVVKQ